MKVVRSVWSGGKAAKPYLSLPEDVTGIPDDLKGNVIHTFAILRAGVGPSAELVEELKQHVRHEILPIAVPAEIDFVDGLPKTRSGKIMRRVLKARVLGLPEGDLSTLEA